MKRRSPVGSVASVTDTVPETITIIRARRGKRLAKLIHRDGVISGYDAAYRFDLIERQVPDLEVLHDILRRLMRRPDCAVVRGAVIDPMRVHDVRRLAYRDDDHGEEPTLTDVPRCWLALDMENIDKPEHVPTTDLRACAVEAIRRLPEAFHSARCIAQATASHGIKPGCRVRLWYWLDRPTHGHELVRWLRRCPADPSVFRTVQPVYTAAPIFDDGLTDHLPERMLTLPGTALVAVPPPEELRPPPFRPAPPLPSPNDTRAARYAAAALRNAASRIRDVGIGRRHDQILKEARGLARLVAAGLLTAGTVSDTLIGAGTDAGKPEDEITSILNWAMANPSGVALPKSVAA